MVIIVLLIVTYNYVMTTYLKKIIFITFLSALTLKSFAPVNESLVIVNASSYNPFKPLISALGKVETNYDTLAYNPVEEAAGYFQIRPIRVEDYNQRTGSNYTLQDMFDYNTSEKVFLYYASQIGPYNFKKIAMRWNGSGPGTIIYWRKVNRYL